MLSMSIWGIKYCVLSADGNTTGYTDESTNYFEDFTTLNLKMSL